GYRLIMDAVDYLLGTLPGACITADRVLGSHVASASGTTCDSTSNDAYATCGPLGGPAEGVTANLGMDVSWRWVPVPGVTYNVAVTAVSGLNAHVTIQREGDCTTESLACGDDPVSADARIERFEPATADPLLITVDSYGECGAYQLAVTCGHDIDADGVCDEVEALCGGDERAGDSDDDDICDDLDRCVGDDYSGDTDGDGVCDDRDTCWPVDATLPPVAPVSDTGLLSRETGVLDRSVLWTAPAAGPYTFHLAARPGALARSVCVRPRCDDQDLAFACDLAAWSTTEPVDATVTWTLDAGETVRVVVGAGIVGDPAPHELTIVCVDSDGDGVCEGQDPCYGASDLDADQDGWCDEVDVCLGDDASGDADDDGVCDSDDLCLGLTNADEDLDGWCDDLDLCVGDDATGDSDQDGVCDSDDPCVGSANTDEDLDGWCDDLDCIGDPASGDSDGDDICDSLDPCHGDQRIEGDRDGDGICDYSGACGQYDFDIASELGLVAHEYNCYHGDRYHGSCNAGNHGDTVFVWHAPYAGTYDISMSSASAAEAQMMYVLDGSDCTSHPAELFCDSWNDSRVRRTVSAGERLRIVVEKQRGIQGYTYEQCGWFDLSIRCVTDRDGDGYCDDADPCPGDTGNDPDGDGVCAAVDACFGDDASGDSDGDGVCDDQD
ncbi:MAG TPA: hypothetical protein PKA64_22990, partial [Myxococcota bacterium]|nr:hypothetical protein [Myxococcota bacterium]